MDLKKTTEEIEKIQERDKLKLAHMVDRSKKILIIGNGGSNAIASHIAVDYVKFLNTQTLSFSDPPMLTAYMNDYGVESAYRHFIEDHIDDPKRNLVILISSSGNSENIYHSARYCFKKGIPFALLTGFDKDNRVRRDFGRYAVLDYWVDAQSYGVVECVHQIYLHMIIDN